MPLFIFWLLEVNINLRKSINQRLKKLLYPIQSMYVSKSFSTRYNEAHIAEQLGLKEISGVGYRKALEFLLKDYIIKNHPEEEEKAKNSLLGKCISDYVDEPRLTDSAKRTAWLGKIILIIQRSG
jgi:hypothetical protein